MNLNETQTAPREQPNYTTDGVVHPIAKTTAGIANNVDCNQLTEFLSILWSGGNQVYFWHGDDKSSLWFHTTAINHPRTLNNVYFGIHPCVEIPKNNNKGELKPPQHVKGQLAYIQCVNCFYAEYDNPMSLDDRLAQFSRLGCEIPSVIIESSPGKHHCYWLLDQPTMITDSNRELIGRTQKRFVENVDGDRDARDLARVLRLPGTFNTKYASPHKVSYVHYQPERRFELEHFFEFTGSNEEPPTESSAAGHRTYSTNLDSVRIALSRLHLERCDNREQWIEVGKSLS